MSTRRTDLWMWIEACKVLEHAERLHRQSFEPVPGATRRPSWVPPADVLETEGDVWVLVAMPGVPAEHVEVQVDGYDLRIFGERRLPAAARAAHIHRLEIPHGRFERVVSLPAWRYELDRRESVDGCLVLKFRKLTQTER